MITLKSVIDITGGELLNTPSITHFSSIAFSLDEISYRSLFVCEDKNEIKEAIKRGAYGILGVALEIVDEEIAFINSSQLIEAKIKLLRYFFIKEKVKLLKCNYLSTLFFKAMLFDDRVYIVGNLDSFPANKNPLFCICEESMANKFGLEFEELRKNKNSIAYTLKGIFELNIWTKKHLKITFCNAFYNEIVLAVEFFEKNGFNYSLLGLKKQFPLETIFFGERAIFLTDNLAVYERIETYLTRTVKWGRVMCQKNPLDFDALLRSNYLYMLLLTDDKTHLETLQNKQREEKLLF